MRSDFKAIERKLIKAIEKVKKANVQRMGGRAKELCPKETGETASKIKIDPEAGTISQDWYIGIFQELGTHDIDEHPYLRPAFDHGVRPMMRDMREAINNAIGL